jgi:type IV pilus assembly protein PilE
MNTRNTSRQSGFTMMELLIVLIIVAILVALAYPAYVNYTRKAKRGDAQQLLMNWSINQEIWRSSNSTYAGTGDLPAPTQSPVDYVFSLSGTPTATTYTLQAVAQGDQLNDKNRAGSVTCSPLTLNESGVKSPADCWD